jgi:hypothetical protein
VIDLKELMRERGASTPGFDHLRLEQVKSRIKRRRVLLAGTLTAAVVLVLFGGYAISPSLRSTPQMPSPESPSPSVSAQPSFVPPPEHYQHNARVALAIAPLRTGGVELMWTPLVWDNYFDILCASDTGGHLEPRPKTEFTVNGAFYGTNNDCGQGIFVEQKQLERAGVKLGQPVKLKVTILGQPSTNGFVLLGVTPNVLLREYPLPPRPAQLMSLSTLRACDQTGPPVVVASDPADPSKPVQLTVTWPKHLNAVQQLTTPGQLAITVGRIKVTPVAASDYEGAIQQVLVTENGHDFWDTASLAGQPVTITVTPSGVTGPWQAGFIPSAGPSFCFLDRAGQPQHVDVG